MSANGRTSSPAACLPLLMNTADRLSAALAVANAGYRIEREP